MQRNEKVATRDIMATITKIISASDITILEMTLSEKTGKVANNILSMCKNKIAFLISK